ncbi:MAG: HAD-IIB family hydrolase [Rhodobacterales bacterium]
MTPSAPLVVFTDLDGTLLDHVSYDWTPARPALDRLAAIGAPVVLSSSKTGAEIAVFQERMGLTAYPAIVENGAGLLTSGTGIPTAQDYAKLRAALGRLPKDLRALFRGFGDMDLAALVEATGLALDDAARAKARAFSEPGLWLGDAATRAAFVSALGGLGISARQGGRFLTLSFGKTKADRMAEVTAQYHPRHVIALGDASNDIEMLEAADVGVVIANPHHTRLPPLAGEDAGRIIRTEDPGPQGWNFAVMALLDRLEQKKGLEPHG